MRVIPAIDIIGGKCVRLQQGDFGHQKTYDDNPLEMALRLEDAGLKHLHLVDLDGARFGRVQNLSVLGALAGRSNLIIDFGGGIASIDDVKLALDHGARQVNIGSLAVKNPKLFVEMLKRFGDAIILSADVRGSLISVNGWQKKTELHLTDLIDSFTGHGLKTVTTTDITSDGMMAGPSLEVYHSLVTTYPDLRIIASGGVSSISDLEALKKNGVYAAIVGKAIYEKRVSLSQLANFSKVRRS